MPEYGTSDAGLGQNLFLRSVTCNPSQFLDKRKYPSPLPSLPQLSNPIRTRATSRSSSPRIPAEIGGFIYSDPRTLQNFSAARKWGIAGLVVFRRRHTPLLFWTLCETFSVSAEVATLVISLFPLGCIFAGFERFGDLLRRYLGLGGLPWPHGVGRT